MPTSLHNDDSSHGEILSAHKEQTVYHTHYYLSPTCVQQLNLLLLDLTVKWHQNIKTWPLSLDFQLVFYRSRCIVSLSIWKYEFSIVGLLADRLFLHWCLSSWSGIYLLVIPALLRLSMSWDSSGCRIYMWHFHGRFQVPGHNTNYSLYFYTYNKMFSWEVMYLSTFQGYYSSAISIQFFSYFNSSNCWTMYTI